MLSIQLSAGRRALNFLAPVPDAGKRIPGVEGLRGLGCMGVAFGHVVEMNSPQTGTDLRLWPLGLALNLFFAASGFLLYLQFAGRFAAGKEMPDLHRFANRRFFRIFPGYIVIFLLTNFVLQASYTENQYTAHQEQIATGADVVGAGMITDPFMFLTNLTLTQTFLPDYIQTGISPSWSLTLELTFYLSLPLCGYSLWWLGRRTRLSKPLILVVPPLALIAMSAVFKALADYLSSKNGGIGLPENGFGPTWLAVLSRSFLVLADTFAFGMLASVIFIAMTTKSIPWITVFRIRMIGISILIISGPLLLACRAWGTRFDNVVLSLISLVIIIWITAPFTLGSTPRLANFIDNRIFYRLGTISLSIYLWHYPVLLLTRRWGLYGDDSIPGMLESAAIVLIPCVILSEITYRLVEAPAQRWEIRRSPNKWPRLHR